MEVYPRAFGRYTLLAPLAQGGMGALHLACVGERGLERLCVIKTVLPHLADKEYLSRFRDEAKVVVRLSHGNLVPVFDAGNAKGLVGEELYLAMDYVDGKDLRAVWNRCARRGIAFPVDVAVYIARELARGLQHAHGFGSIRLVHRDVSPPNILLSFHGEVKLTDFGLASSTLKTEKTAPGVVYGKVSYMSPEQARGEALDGRTDQYAVGIILWELLTGRQLFPSSEPNVIQRVREPKIDPPSKLASRVPPALDSIVMKSLQRDKTLRYADCEGFRAALSGFLAQTAPTTDNDRIINFLKELFGPEIEEEREKRQVLLDALPHRSGQVKVDQGQLSSKPETVSLGAKLPPPEGGDVLGSCIDGRYLVKRLMGEGGMGRVYEAEHIEIGKRVALKVLHPVYSRQADVVARFRSEARAATRIGHPHIVDVFDSGTTVDGSVYFVMEHLQGHDLADTIRNGGPLPVSRAVSIARQVCQALAAAHRANIIHRDIKPENVFLTERAGQLDFVKVLDFGIAKTMDAVTERNRLTNPNVAMGTPEYMAPEQAAGQPADGRADIYAVGAVLYEMLTGKPPFEGSNMLEILSKKASSMPSPVDRYRPDVLPELGAIIMRSLSISPEGRPQTMDDFAEELGRLRVGTAPQPASDVIMRSGPSETARTSRVQPASRRVFAVVASAIAILAVGGVVLAQRQTTPTGATTTAPTNPTTSAPTTTVAAPATPEPPSRVVTVEPLATPTAVATVAKPSPKPQPSPAPRPNTSVVATGTTPAATKPTSKPPSSTAPLITPDTPSATALLRDAKKALDEQRYAQAEDFYRRAGAAGQKSQSLLGLADVAFQQSRYDEAAKVAKQATASGGGPKAWLVLGNAHFKLKQYEDAATCFRKVLQLSPSDVEAQRNLAAVERKLSGG